MSSVDDPALWNNTGLQRCEVGRFKDAKQLLQTAHRLDPNCGDILVNLGFTHGRMNQQDPEERCYRLAAQDASARSTALKNLGLLRLAQGRLQEGWALHHQRETHPILQALHWRGPNERLDSPLLVWNDGGQGDLLQFCRYLPPLIAAGQAIRLAIQNELIPLIKNWLPVEQPELMEIIAFGEDMLRGADRHVPVMSICRLMDPHLRQASQCDQAYLKQPKTDPHRLIINRPRRTRERRIGLCWASNRGDRSLYHSKSIPLELLIRKVPWRSRDQLISLQRGERKERQRWRHRFEAELPDEADWSTTARWLLSCDLVISADTALAHLSGALGIPVVVVLPRPADWRWSYGIQGRRWYPRCTTIQQVDCGDWNSVLPQLNAQLFS